MQVKLFFKSSSPESREDELRTLAAELDSFGAQAEIIDVDTADGADQQQLYDVTQPPTVIVLDPTGSPLRSWPGYVPPATEVRHELGSL